MCTICNYFAEPFPQLKVKKMDFKQIYNFGIVNYNPWCTYSLLVPKRDTFLSVSEQVCSKFGFERPRRLGLRLDGELKYWFLYWLFLHASFLHFICFRLLKVVVNKQNAPMEFWDIETIEANVLNVIVMNRATILSVLWLEQNAQLKLNANLMV